MDFCEKVRQETDFYWEASFAHPFVRGIADGTLPLEKFKMYMLQDAYYLKHYTKVLALAAAKVDCDADIQYFLKKAHFKRRCYYEWLFWEMPWTLQNWAQGVYVDEPTANY